MKNGLIKMTEKEYRSLDLPNFSLLKDFDKPLGYIQNKPKVMETASMKLGTAVHSLVLEPLVFKEIYEAEEKIRFNGDKINKRLKAHREYIENMVNMLGVTIIPSSDKNIFNYRNVINMAKSVKAEIYNDLEQTEMVNIFEFNGQQYKSKIDFINHSGNSFGDIKTIKANILQSDDLLKWKIINAKYHEQLAFYYMGLHLNGVDIKEGKLVFVENSAPHMTRTVKFTSNELTDIFNTTIIHKLEKHKEYVKNKNKSYPTKYSNLQWGDLWN